MKLRTQAREVFYDGFFCNYLNYLIELYIILFESFIELIIKQDIYF